MFCPKCGQQQADDVRFCSRCGFPLAGVQDLIVRGGQLPIWPGAEPATQAAQTESPKRRGLRQGGAMILIATFLIPMLAIMHKLVGIPGDAVLLGVLLFMAGLLRLLYAAIFQPSTPTQTQHQMPAYMPPVGPPLNAARRDALPPAQSISAHVYRPPQTHNTAEMQPPSSVTDHTTRLLDRQNNSEDESR